MLHRTPTPKEILAHERHSEDPVGSLTDESYSEVEETDLGQTEKYQENEMKTVLSNSITEYKDF